MKQFFTAVFLFLFAAAVSAQAPKIINYQGVARNASGVPYAGQQMNVRVSIHTGTPDGAVEFSETRSVTTNQFGLFNIQIGSAGASYLQGSLLSVNWSSGNKFLQTEISVNGQPYVNLGTTQMMSVPFAMHSKEAKELVLPFTQTGSSSTDLLNLTNSDNTTTSSTIKATASAGRAFYGSSNTGTSGYFVSNSGTGVFGYAPNGTGVIGMTNTAGEIGISAINNANGLALSVKGGLRINGGNTNPGAGKILTSDAQGNATWQTPESSTTTVGFIVNGVAQGGLQNHPHNTFYKLHAAKEDYDGNNNYTLYNQTPSSTFTVPVSGLYRFQSNIQMGTNSISTDIEYCDISLVVKRNGIETDRRMTGAWQPGTPYAFMDFDTVMYLTAGDQIWLKAKTSTEDGSNPILESFNFIGYLIK